MHFARTLSTVPKKTANTKVEFVTLRIFPFRKTTAAFLHELRVLPPQRLRLANIELPKSDEWAQSQRAKGVFRRMYEVLKEPRWKFYVKEGTKYTKKSGVPGVWEEVARRLEEQTRAENGGQPEEWPSLSKRTAVPARSVRPRPLVKPNVKRQTSRPLQ